MSRIKRRSKDRYFQLCKHTNLLDKFKLDEESHIMSAMLLEVLRYKVSKIKRNKAMLKEKLVKHESYLKTWGN